MIPQQEFYQITELQHIKKDKTRKRIKRGGNKNDGRKEINGRVWMSCFQ